MDKVLSIKIDLGMKKALEELAEREFAPVTTIVKKALDKYLQENGIDWRQEKPEKKPKR
jgi:predicted transcriptional regulator